MEDIPLIGGNGDGDPKQQLVNYNALLVTLAQISRFHDDEEASCTNDDGLVWPVHAFGAPGCSGANYLDVIGDVT